VTSGCLLQSKGRSINNGKASDDLWSIRRRSEEGLLERTEMRMLQWMLGITLKDRKRNDDIRHAIGVFCITDKIRESRLRWYGHVQQREDNH